MENINKYLLKHTSINYNKLLKNYKKFNSEDEEYEHEDEFILDLNLLLSVKFKDIKVYENKKKFEKKKSLIIQYMINYNKL